MMTLAQRRVYDVLSDVPLTPAQVKRHLPGRVPVATVRSLLAQLQALDLAQTAEHRYTPGITAWIKKSTGERALCAKCGLGIEYVEREHGWQDRGRNFSCPQGGSHGPHFFVTRP